MGGRRITDEQHQQIIERRNNGDFIADIARDMGISEYAAWSHSKDVVRPRSTREPAEPPTDEGELWAEVDGFDGKYMVSSHGRVFATGLHGKRAKLVTVQSTKNGYDYVVLSKNGGHRIPIHRLVAEHFCDRGNQGFHEVRHVDGNLKNNHADNLEWCECGDESMHVKGRRDGVIPKLDDDGTRSARTMYHYGAPIASIARRFGVSCGTVREAVSDVERFSDARLISEPGEEWRAVEGYGGKYQVSSHGRVFSNGGATRKGGLLHIHTRKNGYQSVCLSDGDLKGERVSRGSVPLHRLVALHFCDGHDEVNNVVNHIDGNPSNNHADNLEWCTQSYNVRHAIEVLGRKIGHQEPLSDEQKERLRKAMRNRRGSSCRFTDDEVRAIRSDPRSAHQVAKQYGVNKSTILKIRSRQTYSYVE